MQNKLGIRITELPVKLSAILLITGLCMCKARSAGTGTRQQAFPDTSRYQVVFPDLSKLTEGEDYIIIDPAKDFKAVPCTEKGSYDACSMNIPACDQLRVKICSNQNWNTLVFNKMRRSKGKMKYILLKPGDYRSLQSFYFNGKHMNNGMVSMLYYNPASKTPFIPPNDQSFNSQAILEGIYIYSSKWLFHGLVIDGITLSDSEKKSRQGQSVILGQGSDSNVIARCVIQHASYGIRIRNSNGNTVQDCEIRDIANACSDAPALYVTSENNIPARGNRFLHNIIYNYTDGFQSGREQAGGGADVGGTVLYDNWFFTEKEKISKVNGVEYMPFENALDIKLGGSSETDRLWIINNYTYGWRAGNPGPEACPTDPAGKAITIHRQARHVSVEGNYIWDAVVGIAMLGQLDDIVVRKNFISDIKKRSAVSENMEIQAGSGINVSLSSCERMVIEDNTIQDATKPVSVIGPWYNIDEKKQKISNNNYSGDELLYFESGTAIPKTRDGMTRNNSKGGKKVEPPLLKFTPHKVRDYPYPLPSQ